MATLRVNRNRISLNQVLILGSSCVTVQRQHNHQWAETSSVLKLLNNDNRREKEVEDALKQ